MKNPYQLVIGVIAAIGLTVGVVGCSSDDTGDAFDDTSQSTCFTQLDASQVAQMAQYAQQQGNQVQNAGANTDGTQDICVLEGDENRGYSEHYYGPNDGFQNYLLYSLMFGRSNNLVGFGLLTGALDPVDAIILTSLTGVNSYGQPFHPYSYNNGGWGRQSTVISNKTVNVYYGKDTKPVSYQDSVSKPRAGYAATKPLPKATDQVANGTKRGVKPVADPSKKASSVIGTKPTVKNNAPKVNVPNPQKPNSSNSGGNGSKKPSSGSSGGSKSSSGSSGGSRSGSSSSGGRK